MASTNDGELLQAAESELPRTPSPVKEYARIQSARAASSLSGAGQPTTTKSTSSDRNSAHSSEKSTDHVSINAIPLLDGNQDELPVDDDDPLNTFHTALGIPPPRVITTKPKRNLLGRKQPARPDEKTPKQPKISTKNKGVYNSVVSNERWTRFVYQSCDAVLTFCMFLQIVVGAAVTAFGAGDVNHTIITVFGATNTAVASVLAVFKSKGLPNRLRQDWNGWRELREYIEEKEREIDMRVQGHGEGLPPLDIWATVRDIEARYQTMRLTLEANRPDTYIRVPHSLPR